MQLRQFAACCAVVWWVCSCLAWAGGSGSSTAEGVPAAPDGTLPELSMPVSAERLAWRDKRLHGTKLLQWAVKGGDDPLVMALLVPRPVTRRQERFIDVDLTLRATDQSGRDMEGRAHVMSFMEALHNSVSYFHWSYPKVGGDGRCWVRVHATDKHPHPCSTSHIRKNPQLYPLLYPHLYPEGPPGPLLQRLQCDMSEFAHVDLDASLKYQSFMDEDGGSPLCVQLQVGLSPASTDRASSAVQLFLWHQDKVHNISGSVTSQINGFFNYADIRDPETVDFPVSRLFLHDLEYSLGSLSDGGKSPVLLRGVTCASALASLAEKGNLEDTGPAGDTANVVREVARVNITSTLDPVPNMCFPDLSMKDLDERGDRYRKVLKNRLALYPRSHLKVPKVFTALGAYGYKHRPLVYNYFSTYKPNDTSFFWTLTFQEPSHMFRVHRHTHLNGVTRLERLDAKGNYKVLLAPFTLVYLNGFQIRGRVVAYKDEDLSFSLHAVIEQAQKGTQCQCRLVAEVVPVCLEEDCSEAWKSLVTISMQKVAGLTPTKSCCSTKNCLDPSYDWDKCR